MEKKQYIAPSMEATEVEVQTMIATSNPDSQFGIYDDTTEDDANMSNNRRGTWGNFWN